MVIEIAEKSEQVDKTISMRSPWIEMGPANDDDPANADDTAPTQLAPQQVASTAAIYDVQQLYTEARSAQHQQLMLTTMGHGMTGMVSTYQPQMMLGGDALLPALVATPGSSVMLS